MRCRIVRSGLALGVLMQAAAVLAETPVAVPVTLKAADGIALKGSYYAAGQPGPGLLLLHQCNRDRSAWASLAKSAAERGFHVLTMDYRGYGESEGQRFESYLEQQPVMQQKWPGDIDAAFAWLRSQPGVDGQRIGAAGASCGVNQSVLLARRHPEVRTVVLLSGGVSPEGRDYLRRSPWLPVMASASEDDGDATGTMQWILGWSRNPANKYVGFKAAGHGTDMFAVEKTLEPAIVEWFDRHLRHAPVPPVPPTLTDSKPSAVEEFWAALTSPDGERRAREIFEETRRTRPSLMLFPEGEANLYGYELLQNGSAPHALWVFQLNVDAYPKSANTYDSLSDAYLALGQREKALQYAERALKVLETDTHVNHEFRTAIKESAEKKVRELRKGSSPPQER
ncbi:MAG TPA: alpha/beta fold hydrolase [Vicinamibacterales bacterium]|nr:alpha/beta fold hydrolase [Vicinamibacterales bacterium]